MERIIGMLKHLNTNKVVFKDKENRKLSPIIVDGIEICGVFLSVTGIWFVDSTHIKHDISNNIRPWYFDDKHHISKFSTSVIDEVVNRLKTL